MLTTNRWLPIVRRAGVVVLVVLVGWSGWTAFKVWRAWDGVDRFAFDTEGARAILAAEEGIGGASPGSTAATGGDPGPGATTTTAAPTPTIDRHTLNTFLVIGTDERESDSASVRADVILLAILPPETNDLILTSIPRDLYLPSPCGATKMKINANLNGCGDQVSGPELMAIAVEDYTGIRVDHFAVFDFSGFVRIIDAAGGVEVCVGDYPVRDSKAGLSQPFEMPAGCNVADGEKALGWVRSRRTEQLVNGTWQRMGGINDLTRNERQRELLVSALARLKDVRDINQLTSVVERLADTFTIDEGLGVSDAVGMAWDIRGISFADIYRPVLEVSFSTTAAGESILVPVGTFEEAMRSGYPNADLIFGAAD